MKKLLAVAVVVSAIVGYSKEVEFVPTVANANGSYSLTNAQNWVGGVVPGVDDVQVFKPTGTLLLAAEKKQSGYHQFAGMKFLSGSTFVTDGTYLYANASETELYVAEGASVSCTNVIDTWSANYRIVKTGPGTFACKTLGADKTIKAIEAREGMLKVWSCARTSSVRIFDGATFWAAYYNFFRSVNPDVQVDKGGKFRVQGGSGAVNVGCLTGEGEIFDNNFWTDFQIKPTRDCVFNGTMDAEVHAHIMTGSAGRFILGSANVFPEDGTVTGSRWLGFAPDVGKFVLGNFKGDVGYPLHLADTNGAPVTAVVRLTSDNAKVFSADGPGSVQCNYYGVTFTGNPLQNTGKVLNNMWGAVTFGDGTAANDFDFSALGGLAGLTGGSIFNINNAAATTIGGTLTGPSGSSVNFNAPSTTLKDIRTSGSALALKGDVTVDGGDAAVSGVSFGSADKTLTVNDGRLSGTRAKPNANSDPVGNGPLTPTAFALGGSQAGSKVVVNGGDVWLKGATSVQTLEQNGGAVHFTDPAYEPMASATAANPCVVRFNGGRTYLDRRDTIYYNNFTPFSSGEALQLLVGAGGAEFVGYGVYSRTSRVDGYGTDENWDIVTRPLLSDVRDGVDGGVKQKGFMGFRYSYPLQITGTYEAEGGSTYLADSYDLSGKSYFGSGDTVLRNHRLELANRTESFAFRPHGEGKALKVVASAMLHLRKNSSGAPVNVEMDALQIDRGALFLMDPVAFGGANASTVKLATAPATAANGRVYLPVVSTKDSASFSFVGYDTEKGFTNLTITASSSFTNTDPTKLVRINSSWTDAGANKKLCAEALLLDNYTTLKLGDKTTVTIGDGVHPALLLMPSYGIDGEATASVEFGTSEGVIVLGTCGAASDCQSRLLASIKSANGLTIVGWPSLNAVGTVGVRFNRANTYSGDTRIGAAIVQAENETCFSSGDVLVTGGQRYGGGVRFKKEGGVWANNFTIAGRGVLKSRWDGWDNHTGAMAFWKSGKVTGGVELTDEARLAATNGAFGEIAGVISGAGKAVLLHSTGVLRFSNANTYAGGTDLIGGSTLELAKGDSAGTGEVLLSESTLRFVNDEPITFTNEVFGSGTIEIAGAPVTFTGRAFAALNGRALAKGTTIAFPAVDAAAVKYAAVLAGGVLDLGGEDQTFGQVWGSGRVTGGTATIAGEIQPGGANAIGTLTFDRPPVFASGATFVCEDLEGACDKVVVEGGDMALDDLGFAFTLIGAGRGKGSATVLAVTDGAVSGEFASVTKTPEKAERAEVEYGASKVDMILSQGLLLLVR